jgi:hypothetical protein
MKSEMIQITLCNAIKALLRNQIRNESDSGVFLDQGIENAPHTDNCILWRTITISRTKVLQ